MKTSRVLAIALCALAYVAPAHSTIVRHPRFRVTGYNYAIAMSHDHKLVAVGGDHVTLFDTATNKKLFSVEARIALIYSMVFSPDDKTLYVGGYGEDGDFGSIGILNIATHKLREFVTPSGTRGIAVGGNNIYFVEGSDDGKRGGLYAMRTSPPLKIRRITHTAAYNIAITNVVLRLSSIEGKSIVIRSADSGAAVHRLSAKNLDYCVAFSPDGKALYAIGAKIARFNTSQYRRVHSANIELSSPANLKISPDGRTIGYIAHESPWTGSYSAFLKLVTANSFRDVTPRNIKSEANADDQITDFAFVPDTSHILILHASSEVYDDTYTLPTQSPKN